MSERREAQDYIFGGGALKRRSWLATGIAQAIAQSANSQKRPGANAAFTMTGWPQLAVGGLSAMAQRLLLSTRSTS